ncbi:MAG TPA: hypothetical protein VE710_18815 [Candidatus Bathyarchaeia archaeon]|nr:hypothetical protein [Candidatus Bathyarchaeia archaeon]
MVNALIITAAVIIACIYFFSKKYLFAIEHIWLFQFYMFVYTTAFSVIGHNKAVEVTKQMMPYLTLRIVELIIPMTILLFVDRWHALSSWIGRVLAGLLCLGILFGFEALAAYANYVIIVNWTWWKSTLWWLFSILIVFVSQRLFRRFIKGVM